MVETELVASSRTFVSLYNLKDEILEELRNCVTDVHQHLPCSSLIDEWDNVAPLNTHPFLPRGKSLKWEFKLNIAQL
jgi:hypothetical protein